MKPSLNLKLLAALSVALAIAACAKTRIPPSQQLNTLRILALVVDTPEISPGGTVTVTPWLSDFTGGGRTLTFSVKFCPAWYGVEYYECGEVSPTTIELIRDQKVTGLAAPNYTGAGPSFQVSVPAVPEGFADLSVARRFNGAPYRIEYNVRTEDGKAIYRANKAIVVSTKTPKNSNPQITALLANGIAPTRYLEGGAQLNAEIPESSAELFQYQDPATNTQVEATDQLSTSWYISEGELSATATLGRIRSLSYSPPETRSGKDLVIVAVTVDDRGGAAVKVLELPIGSP